MKQRNIWKIPFSLDLMKRIFLCAAILGIVAHGSGMFNLLLWHDGLRYGFQVYVDKAVALGRWMRALMTGIVQGLFGGANLGVPAFYGMASVFFIAVSALFIIHIFKIKEKTLQIILCGVMISIPVVTSTFFYMFTAAYYFFALLLATLAVWFAREHAGASGFVLGALCVCCCLGLYQTYIAVTVSLFVILLIFDIVDDRYPTLQAFFKRAFYYLGICAVGFALYLVVWKVCMLVLGVNPTDYQGVSNLGQKSIATYLQGVRTAYARFFLVFTKSNENIYPMGLRIIQIALTALSILFSIWLVARKFRNNLLQGIALALLIALLPLCMNVVYLMGAENVHTLMLYGQCMLYVYLICIIRHIIHSGVKFRIPLYRLSAALLLVLIAMNVFFDNGCYMKAEMVMQQTISNLTVLVGRIKSQEEYRDDMPVCIAIKGKQDATVPANKLLAGYAITPLKLVNPPLTNRAALRDIKAYLERWCGFSPKYVSYEKFKHKEVFDEMPDYPDAGSVRIVDGTVVVRM